MAKAKDQRINAYFGKSIEDKEVWDYLSQYEDGERSYQLKHLAYLSLMNLMNNPAEPPQTKPATTRRKRTVIKKEPVEQKAITPIVDSSDTIPKEKTNPTDNNNGENEVRFSLNDLIIEEPAEDPEELLQKSFNKFIVEDEDDLIIAQQLMQTKSESAK